MAITLTVGATDVSNFLADASMTAKLNTLDFGLYDPVGAMALGDAVVLTDSAQSPPMVWSGTLVGIEKRPAVGKISGHQTWACTATNTATGNVTSAPFDLSDAPANTTGHIEQEGSAFDLLLEDGSGYILTEGTLSYDAWQGLSIKTQTNTDATTSIYGQVTVFRNGLQVGNTILVTCADIAVNTNFVIAQVTTTWPAKVAIYLVELGHGVALAAKPITGRVY